MRPHEIPSTHPRNHRLFPWMALAVLAAACVGMGFPTDGSAGQPAKVWRDAPADAEPLLPNGYSPLPSLSGLVKKMKPTVVNVYTTQVIKPRTRRRERIPLFRDPFFGEFFQFPQGEFKRNSLGSGFIISPNGYVITNHHVVANASEIKVKLADERTFQAKLVGSDQKTDIALLKIEPEKALPFALLGDSDDLEVGDWVIAIGNPFGLGHTVTAGIVSGKDRQIGQGPYDDFLQTDAAINPGNSGGPLFDSAGRVVGINAAIITGGSGVGFAVPINLAKDLVPQLRTDGRVTRGWLGVGIQDLTGDLADKFGVEGKSGVLISQVFAGSPADEAGLKAGDVILSLDGKPVRESRQLTARIARIPPGKKARIEVLRAGKNKRFAVTLGEREKGEAQAAGRHRPRGLRDP